MFLRFFASFHVALNDSENLTNRLLRFARNDGYFIDSCLHGNDKLVVITVRVKD